MASKPTDAETDSEFFETQWNLGRKTVRRAVGKGEETT